MSKRDWTFEVETVEAGQRRKYGDSHYHFIVTSRLSVNIIKDFCTNILYPAISASKYREITMDGCDFGNHFTDHYTRLESMKEVKLLEDGDNIVEYKVVSPSTH